MSGGSYEYVAAYINNGHSYLTTYGSSLVNGDAKTKNVYTKASTDDSINNYNQNAGVYGDAIYETSSNGSGITSWYGDGSVFPDIGTPFFRRGGYYSDDSYAGMFCFHYNYGSSSNAYSFRPVLAAI